MTAPPKPGRAAALIDDGLLAALGVAALLPDSLAAWRPLALAGLACFLDQLPPARQTAIIATQLLLPADSSAAARLVSLFGQCPSLHKLGQVVARHRGLPPELRRALQALESLPASLPTDAIVAAIGREIGPVPGLQIADAILAEGSVAVVVPFRWDDEGVTRHGVFKLLKPGIEARLAEELAVFVELAAFLRRRAAGLGLPALDYDDALDSVRRLLGHEIRLDVEQHNLRLAAVFYAGEPRLLIPRLLPWCTPRLTAMQRVFGVRVTDAELGLPARRRLAATLVETLLGQPFWNADAATPLHADLHAGNLMLADDGRVAVLDWSLVARLDKRQREALVGIALGGLTLDAPAITAALLALGGRPADAARIATTVERALDRLVDSGGLPAFDWLLALFDDLLLSGVGGFGEDLALLRKSWLSLRGAIGDLVDDPSPDAVLLALGGVRFLAELPARALAPPLTADFSTHVSNLDLWRLGLSPGLVAWRYWLRRLRPGR